MPAKAQTTSTGGSSFTTVWQPSPPAGVTPSATVDSIAYLSFRPNPVGTGQPVLVNMWTVPPLNRNRYHSGYTVTITKPDGTQDVIGPLNSYCGDATSWFEYVVDQVGTWKLKFNVAGNYYPEGYYTDGVYSTTPIQALPGSYQPNQYLGSAYYKPTSTAEQELIVQSEPIRSYPGSPLPTDYWTRPISSVNREWWSIAGNYPFNGQGGGSTWPAKTNTYMSNYAYYPWIQGPKSAHIAWKQLASIYGLIGGVEGQTSFGVGIGGGGPSIVYDGRCYQTVTRAGTSSTTSTTGESVWRCYDLRTGEVYWEIPLASGQSAPTAIDYQTAVPETPGEQALGVSVSFVSITSPSTTAAGRIIKYNPLTGAVNFNVTGPPPGVSAGTLYNDPYVLSIQTIRIGTTTSYRLINWTIENDAGLPSMGVAGGQPTVDNFTARIKNNITFPFSSIGTCDFEAGVGVQQGSINSNGTGITVGTIVMGASLLTGQLLWNVSTDSVVYSGGVSAADHGKFAVCMRQGYWLCWDLASGKQLWKSELMDYPWGASSFGAYSVASGYGLLFRYSYDGVYAFDWDTGKIVWHYIAPSNPFENAYSNGVNSAFSPFDSGGKIADGVLYTFNTEHTPTQPLARSWKLHAINVTTGEGVWNITGSMSVGAIADGYLVASNQYDGYMYVFGKGKSATTASVSPAVTTNGNMVLIQGTVLDQSPGQPGTPCVSKDSMATQMQYLHMQMPIDGIYHNETMTGVPVTLTAIGSDGSVTDIGTVTTNAYYGTFSKAWTPPKEDTYTIAASFTGDDSYGSSSAATAVAIGPAPTITQPNLTNQVVDTTPILYAVIGVGIAIVIAVALAVLILRRK